MRRRAAALTALGLALVTGCGGDDNAGSADPFKEVSTQPTLTRTARHAAPRWERVARFAGTAPATHPVSIAAGAIQWRVRWRCASGRLKLSVTPVPRSAPEQPGGTCPGSGETTWVQTGDQRLSIDVGGRWSAVVEQQVDTPIDEPMLAAMKAKGARRVLDGSFRPVERQGSGRARIYRLASGRVALRLDPFKTSSNTDLFVWLSAARRPRTTKQVVRARRIGNLIALKATIGAQNYLLPAGVNPRRIHSIAIWCAPIQIVYTVAALKA